MATGQKSKKQIGIYISALTRLTVGLEAQKYSPASAYNTIIYLFLLIRRYNYRYTVICQHLAMDFLIFPNLSMLVNVCQRMIFHGCV